MISNNSTHPLIKQVRELSAQKQTHLCLSLDVTTSAQLLKLTEQLAPYILMIKTHIDILEDFSWDVIEKLIRLSEKHQFLIFEDRKFADIGNTVSLQYGKGIYRIADWAHLTNAHILPGPGIIDGLKKVGLPKQRGLLLLAEMSSEGHLLTPDYQQQALALAKVHKDFVVGFIAQHRMANAKDFLIFTPGVQISSTKDNLGQRYKTPAQAIADGADVIIVGRGIYQSNDPVKASKAYLGF